MLNVTPVITPVDGLRVPVTIPVVFAPKSSSFSPTYVTLSSAHDVELYSQLFSSAGIRSLHLAAVRPPCHSAPADLSAAEIFVCASVAFALPV